MRWRSRTRVRADRGNAPVSPFATRSEDPRSVSRMVAARAQDDGIVKIAAIVLIGAVVVGTVAAGASAAGAIDSFRTFVTQYFTWYLVLLAAGALVFCLFMAFSRRGNIVLGGPDAEREYSNFAWYSMLFACGQGVGLIFWSVAEPILVLEDNPLAGVVGTTKEAGALVWTYFHWSLHAWAIYCVVALCLALSFHNRNAPMTFRDSVVMMFPDRLRRPVGVVIEVLAIMATVFGLATSFAFAAMQMTSGISATFGVAGTETLRTMVIVVIGLVGAGSVYIGVDKGMKRLSEANSVLSVVLLIGVLVFGPTLYILSVLPETLGAYTTNLWQMGLWTDAANSSAGIANWSEAWNGPWTVFIWSWCWAFSPFVGSFVARISRGRTVREFVVGVLGVPSLICVVWIGVIGSAALYLDARNDGAVTKAVGEDVSMGLFAALDLLPHGAIAVVLMAIATILVGTYFVTSLDSGVHALSGFAASAARPSRPFRVGLVVGIAAIAFLLLSLGGETAVGTVQTGTVIGAIPFTVVVMVMMTQATSQTADRRSAINQVREEETVEILPEEELDDIAVALPANPQDPDTANPIRKKD